MSRREFAVGAAASLTSFSTADGVIGHPFRYVRDDATIDSYLARPDDGRPRRAVIVLHGNAGVPTDVAATAHWLAEQGFVGLAVSSTSREPDPSQLSAEFLGSRAYQDRYVADAREGVMRLRLERFATEDQIGVVGYCGGGYAAIWWASRHDGEIGAIVGVHVATRPLRSATIAYDRPAAIDLVRELTTPMQFHQGGADNYTPPQDIDELRRVGRRRGAQIGVHVYDGATHGFALSTRDSYRSDHTATVRRRAAAFLRRTLRP